ncbi:hydroxymethylpyrimidine/phosphomethylpyrimidine kinase [bacterium]|nr:hydroxymethylpyrimidine/phosphomethylpyrimidine kinase [bacterium]
MRVNPQSSIFNLQTQSKQAGRPRSRDGAPKCLLAVGGLDPSGAAGILVDARVFAAYGFHPLAVATALTTQTLDRFVAANPVPARLVRTQLELLLATMPVAGIKIGMLGTPALARAVAEAVRGAGVPIVVDPVRTSSSGGALAPDHRWRAMMRGLAPIVTAMTPNAHEAQAFSGISIENRGDIAKACESFYDAGLSFVVLTGGHLSFARGNDFVFGGHGLEHASGKRRRRDVRGTGCVHASALAAHLARGDDPVAAARGARAFVEKYIDGAARVGRGPRARWMGRVPDSIE